MYFESPIFAKKTVDFSPLPNGVYFVTIESIEDFDYNRKTGVKFAFKVLDGEYEGRKVWKQLYFGGDELSDKAKEYSYNVLRNIVWASGLDEVGNTDELVGKIFDINVVCEESYNGNGKIRNDITYYSPHKEDNGNYATNESNDTPW